MPLMLIQERETEVRELGLHADLGAVEAAVNVIEDAGDWPEGFDAVAVDIPSGRRWLLEEGSSRDLDGWVEIT